MNPAKLTQRLGLILCAVAATVGLIAPTPAHAVSWVSGLDPYTTGCASNGTQWISPAQAVYDGSLLVGYGYLRYSYGCQANWSEFDYRPGYAYDNYTVEPWAWEKGKTGTDQTATNLWGDLVHSLMVDGRGKACAGGHLYHYPSHSWISWNTYYCNP